MRRFLIVTPLLCVLFACVWQVAAARRAARAASSAARMDTASLTAPASLLAVLAADAEELRALAGRPAQTQLIHSRTKRARRARGNALSHSLVNFEKNTSRSPSLGYQSQLVDHAPTEQRSAQERLERKKEQPSDKYKFIH